MTPAPAEIHYPTTRDAIRASQRDTLAADLSRSVAALATFRSRPHDPQQDFMERVEAQRLFAAVERDRTELSRFDRRSAALVQAS
jgi:hypothetical protein